ncbi:MAG: hypothetical protein BGO43_01970 [Gammaproteobacteria bacterium 39-13]|jgi:hypothetical protein|nr:hypothetical protein [Gammaproteobacteria bacterium]OJV91848.1 MAG: hypothetical protein BGO43_01970 [Gammaproteobacteria bacterium 39-13]
MAIVFTPGATRASQSPDKPKQEIDDVIELSPKAICPLYNATKDFFDAMDPANEPKNTLHGKNRHTF